MSKNGRGAAEGEQVYGRADQEAVGGEDQGWEEISLKLEGHEEFRVKDKEVVGEGAQIGVEEGAGQDEWASPNEEEDIVVGKGHRFLDKRFHKRIGQHNAVSEYAGQAAPI